MRAVRMHGFGGPEVLRIDEVGVPLAGAGQVLIEVTAAGIAYGDVMKRRGAFGTDLPLPSGLGGQVAGTVVDRGPADGTDVALPAVGARVLAWVEHGCAEYAVAPASSVVPLPDGVDPYAAALLPVQGVTAYQTLVESGGLRTGDTVLVHAAAGGVGGLAVQLARLLGAETVIGTASGPKLGHVRDLGADEVIDYTVRDWEGRLARATGGRGVDLALDSVGGEVALRSLDQLAPFGRMVSFGAAGGVVPDLPGMALMTRNQSVVGYSLAGWLARAERTATAITRLLRFVERGDLRMTIGSAVGLDDAGEAHRAIDERRVLGGTVLLPGGA